MFNCLIVHFMCGIRVTHKPKVYDYYDVCLICNHEVCPGSMYCCIACLDCINCSGMCACLPALCCWRWIVWCMHVWTVMFILVLNCEVL